MKLTKNTKGLLTALLSVIAFSSYPAFGKTLLNNLSPEVMTAISQGFAVLSVILIFGLLPEIKKIRKLPKRDIFLLVLISLLAAVIAPLLLLKGLATTSATNVVLLLNIEVVLTCLIAYFWLKEKLTKEQIIGTVIMFLGIAVITTRGFNLGMDFNGGDFLILAATLFWAIATVIFKKYLSKIAPELAVLFRNIFGVVFLTLMIVLIFPHQVNDVIHLDFSTILVLIAFSVLGIFLAQLFWYRALEMISASKVSTITLSEPLFGILFVALLLGEGINSYQLAGGALVLLGLIFMRVHLRRLKFLRRHVRFRHPHRH